MLFDNDHRDAFRCVGMVFDNHQWCYNRCIRLDSITTIGVIYVINVAMRFFYNMYRCYARACILVMSYTGTAPLLFLHAEITSFNTGFSKMLFFCVWDR
jgi:hypothetical protein